MRFVRFADRATAGAELGGRLRALGLHRPVVLAIPRGGVVVAASVASALDAPVDVLDLHQVTAHRPDLSIGTVSSTGEEHLHPCVAGALGVSPEELRERVGRQRRELADLMARVHTIRGTVPVPVYGRAAVVVDDGLRVASVAAVAAEQLRRAGADRCVLAVPVGSSILAAALGDQFDDIVVLEPTGGRYDVAEWYRDAHRVTPDEVVGVLAAAPARSRGSAASEASGGVGSPTR
jgi:putative phosphoribosyl transferase